jgi:hypothetical protein
VALRAKSSSLPAKCKNYCGIHVIISFLNCLAFVGMSLNCSFFPPMASMDQLWDPFSEVCRDVYCAADLEFVECECRGTPTNSRYLATIRIMPTSSSYLATIRIMPTKSRLSDLATIRILPTNSRYTDLATIGIHRPSMQVIRSCHHPDHARRCI